MVDWKKQQANEHPRECAKWSRDGTLFTLTFKCTCGVSEQQSANYDRKKRELREQANNAEDYSKRLSAKISEVDGLLRKMKCFVLDDRCEDAEAIAIIIHKTCSSSPFLDALEFRVRKCNAWLLISRQNLTKHFRTIDFPHDKFRDVMEIVRGVGVSENLMEDIERQNLKRLKSK